MRSPAFTLKVVALVAPRIQPSSAHTPTTIHRVAHLGWAVGRPAPPPAARAPPATLPAARLRAPAHRHHGRAGQGDNTRPRQRSTHRRMWGMCMCSGMVAREDKRGATAAWQPGEGAAARRMAGAVTHQPYGQGRFHLRRIHPHLRDTLEEGLTPCGKPVSRHRAQRTVTLRGQLQHGQSAMPLREHPTPHTSLPHIQVLCRARTDRYHTPYTVLYFDVYTVLFQTTNIT